MPASPKVDSLFRNNPSFLFDNRNFNSCSTAFAGCGFTKTKCNRRTSSVRRTLLSTSNCRKNQKQRQCHNKQSQQSWTSWKFHLPPPETNYPLRATFSMICSKTFVNFAGKDKGAHACVCPLLVVPPTGAAQQRDSREQTGWRRLGHPLPPGSCRYCPGVRLQDAAFPASTPADRHSGVAGVAGTAF